MSRSTAGAPGVNLMPLLDVLLCTMGTLIIILGIINREARLHPAKRLPGQPTAAGVKPAELADARDDLQYRVQQLAKSREKTLADLQESRTRLAGIEDHSRRLEDQLHTLSAAIKQLQDTDHDSDAQRNQLRAQLLQLNTQRMQLDNTLKQARQQGSNRQPIYAVIPFEDIYKTNRRPIYIECRSDQIILQPEGIVLTRNDFLGPDGPNNPLAAAIRAAQEYWRQAPRSTSDLPNEPYPLVLVRPDGIRAYNLVRAGMSLGEVEFGYELIGQDWKLDFPMQPEPQLKVMEERAVADCRRQLAFLAQSAPEVFAQKPTGGGVKYRVSPVRGGVVREGGGTSLESDPYENDPLDGFGLTSGGNSGPSPNGMAVGGSGAAGGYGPGGNGTAGAGYAVAGNGGSTYGGVGSRAGGNGLMNSAGGAYAGNYGNGNSASAPGASGNLGGSGFGNATGNQSLGGGAELAQVGPRYAGAAGSLANGTGFGAGGSGTNIGNTGNSGTNIGQAGANGNGSANGNANADTTSSQSPGQRGSRELNPNEYGYAAMPGATAGSPGPNGMGGSSAGAAGSSSSGGAPGAAGNMAGASGSTAYGSSAGAASAGGMSASSGSESASGGAGPQSSLTSADPNQPSAGMPSLSFDMSPHPQPQPFNDTPSQQSQQTQSSSPSRSHSAMQYRGKNWALPNMHNAAVPVERSIRVECWNDRLVLLPDTHDQQAQIIPLAQHTEDSVDELVAAVRTYTKTWGMAGRGMYWKPQLVLDVNANADARAADLQNLLADSGWNVKRR